MFDVTGKSYQDIMNLPYSEIKKMGRNELARVTSRLTSTANKRIKRFERKGIDYLSDTEHFSVKDKDTIELLKEFNRAKEFLSKKTTTLKEFNKWRKFARDHFIGDNIDEDEFWRIYKEMYHDNVMFEHFKYSTFETIRTEIENKNLSSEKIAKETLKKIIDEQAGEDINEEEDYDAFSIYSQD